MITFADSGHPVFRGTSALPRGLLKSKGGGNTPKHHNDGAGDFRAVTTHHYFRQSAQCPRSRGGLVPRSCSANRSSFLHVARGHPLRTWRMIPRRKSHQRTYRTSPNHQSGILEHQETWCGNTKRNSKTSRRLSINESL